MLCFVTLKMASDVREDLFVCWEDVNNLEIPVRSSWLCQYVCQSWCEHVLIANLLFVDPSPVQGWCSEGFPAWAQFSAFVTDLLLWPLTPQRVSSPCVPSVRPGTIPGWKRNWISSQRGRKRGTDDMTFGGVLFSDNLFGNFLFLPNQDLWSQKSNKLAEWQVGF